MVWCLKVIVAVLYLVTFSLRRTGMKMMRRERKMTRGRNSPIMSKRWLWKKKSMETLIWIQKMKVKKNSIYFQKKQNVLERAGHQTFEFWIAMLKAAYITQGSADSIHGQHVRQHIGTLYFQPRMCNHASLLIPLPMLPGITHTFFYGVGKLSPLLGHSFFCISK